VLNKNILLSKMVLHGDKQADLAVCVGLSPQRLNAKLNGTDGAEFNRPEIAKIKERYNLTDEEIVLIFFTDDVS